MNEIDSRTAILPDLKPCFFCNSNDLKICSFINLSGKIHIWIECLNCYYRSDSCDTDQQAIISHNKVYKNANYYDDSPCVSHFKD